MANVSYASGGRVVQRGAFESAAYNTGAGVGTPMGTGMAGGMGGGGMGYGGGMGGGPPGLGGGGIVTYPPGGRPGMGAGGGGGVVVNPGPPADGCCAAGCAGGPESDANCGGVGAVCCEASGTMVTGTRWTYVGSGGDFAPATSYNYVGQGCGSYTKEVIVQPYGCKLRLCCIVVSLLLLLLPFLYWLFTCQTVTTTPVPTVFPGQQSTVQPLPQPVGKCLIWGDPHGLSFDGKRNDFYSKGEYWAVKSTNVWIQVRYLPTRSTNGLAVCKELALGGPFLKGHKLIVGPQEATIDDHPILQTFPSCFHTPDGLIDMKYDSQGTVMQEGREGKALHIVHIRVNDGTPEGVIIQVNRWNEPGEGSYINVKIIMHRQPEGQDGHCGNFNGNPVDDDRLQIRARLGKTGVPQSELLFRTKTPVVEANRPNINDCPQQKLDQCKAMCKQKQHKFIPSMDCLVDCCFAAAGFMQEG